MFSREERRKRKIYRERLNEFKEKFETFMLDPLMRENRTGGPSWNTMDLWATSIMMDEAKTLSRLTRWLIVLSTVLSALTVVLAYPILRSLLG